MTKVRRFFENLSQSYSGSIIFLAITVLILLGLVVLSSAGFTYTEGKNPVFLKQLFWLVLSVFMGIGAFYINVEHLNNKRFVFALLGITVFLLVCVLIPGIGIKVNGARRWLNLGFSRLQMSEFAKITFVVALAWYMGNYQRQIKSFFVGFLIPSIAVGFMCGLIIIEPDFGTAFLCGIVSVTIFFLVGVRLIYLIPSIFGALMLFSVAIFYDPVRFKRITSFLDVEVNKLDGAYQLWQGILAFSAGGTSGVGLGNGRQQMAFLPEAHTDFIFPIIGEELGFFTTFGVVGLLFVIFIFGMSKSRQAPNLNQFCLVSGALLFIILQSLINIGVVTGCLPTKGISLPFISYGGSNLMVMCIFVGLILNCYRRWDGIPLKRVRDL